MSKTRNQRRQTRWERLALVVMSLLLLLALALCVKLWREIEANTQAVQEAGGYRYEVYSPKDFDLVEYRAACQRYDVEHGLVLPHLEPSIWEE